MIKERLSITHMPTEDMLNQTELFVEAFAKEGLRTLFIAEKTISPEVYLFWSMKYAEACRTLNNRDEAKSNVAETINSFKEAGIIVWVLTGDKIETAINIGYSCGLLHKDMIEVVIDVDTVIGLQRVLSDAQRLINASTHYQEISLIVSGSSLIRLMTLETSLEVFLELCDSANVVIACRVSPK